MRFLRLLGMVVVIGLAIPIVAVQFFGDPIARRVVGALNDRLQTEIEIETYDLSLLRSFPHLSADLRGVSVAGSDGSQLLKADRLACRLDLLSLFGKVRITGIVVQDGELRILTDVDGNANYQLAGYTSVGDRTENSEPTGVAFQVTEARLRNVGLFYQDRQLSTEASLAVGDATFSGDFGNESYVLTADADVEVAYLDEDGFRYLSEEKLRILANTTIDHTAGSYAFAPLRLYSGDLSVEANGILLPTTEGIRVDLQLSTRSGSLEDVFALLPPDYATTLGELETSGDLSLTATVAGEWSVNDYPRIDGQLTFTDGRLGSPRMNVGARDLELTATFAYLDGPRGGVQTFAVERLTGNFRGEPFDLGLRLEDLNDPVITFRADGSLPLSAIPAFLPEGRFTEGDGLLRLRDVRLSGRYADMQEARRMGRVASSGTIDLENASLRFGEQTVSFPSGTLVLSDNALSVTDLTFESAATRLRFSGEATNLIPVLFSDSLNTRDAALEFEARLQSDNLDVDELMSLLVPEAEPSVSTQPDSLARRARGRRARITELLNGRFEAEIREWNWDLLTGTDFRGQLLFSPGQLAIRGITEAMEGEFRVDATTDFGLLTHTNARITARGVDAEKFFYQNENFGQDFLTSDNLEGSMNAQLLLDLYYDEDGALNYNRLRALVGMEILDGELRDFEMLENFAFALKTGDLERVRFTRLANYIEITDRTVYLPAMFIQSSAINLTLSGTHTFDQYLEYYIRVNAGQVIANKISRHDDNLEVLPARNGLFNLYYTILGPLETYQVETDKRAVKEDFRRSEYRRDRIRRTLEERFQAPLELLPPIGDEDLSE